MRILKAFSVLLCYPSRELQAAIPAIRAIVDAETRLDDDHRQQLSRLLDRLADTDIYELEEDYVMLFDRSRTLSLNLFEHVHGESRDRGSAMVDLLQTYQEAGFDLNTSELPDHLPVLLEFLSTRPEAEAMEILRDAGAILIALADRLDRRQSHYAAILHALTDMASANRHDDEAQQLLAETMDNPNDLEALDAVWEETMVTFGPESMDSCSGL
ncbi:MAG TPA: nitrate reductase molybdenum cofactor assembly chaperone, partial [Burkholderiaceae bacterium]|nr:nitrate reductase molybdenum cofactor assembly chaperone [Burkholderiaceae bacterium]